VWFELGRPLRALNVFRRPQASWMTRESYVAVALFAVGLFAVATKAWPGVLPAARTPLWAAAALAALFLFAQARILIEAKGIPAWREPALQPLILTTGLTEGVGVMLALAPLLAAPAPAKALLLALCAVRGMAWLGYLRRIESGAAPRAASAALRRAHARFIGLGHVVPSILLIAALPPSPFSAALAAVAGLAALAAGWEVKYLIIARAAYNQGIALPLTPVRGAGETVAGPRPGWPDLGQRER
jgi:phenylacetyl-CoA:acceptor oxidoreductase subunit 2